MDYTDVLTLIRKMVRSINLESKRIEKVSGASIPQLLCLHFLNSREFYQASHKEIKDYLSLNASTVTGIINRLQNKGLVAKLPKRDDRRVRYVTLTARGADLLRACPGLSDGWLVHKLKGMSTQEQEALKNAFDLIVQFLETGEEGPSEALPPSNAAQRTD